MKPMLVDNSIISSIEVYFMFGINPGSFTTRLITSRYDGIEDYAHPLIRHLIDDHIRYTEMVLPKSLRGPANFRNWKGYNSCSEEEQQKIEEYALFIALKYNEKTLKRWIDRCVGPKQTNHMTNS